MVVKLNHEANLHGTLGNEDISMASSMDDFWGKRETIKHAAKDELNTAFLESEQSSVKEEDRKTKKTQETKIDSKKVSIAEDSPEESAQQTQKELTYTDITTNAAQKQDWLKNCWDKFLSMSGSNPYIHKAYCHLVSAIPYDFKDGVIYISARTEFGKDLLTQTCQDALAQLRQIDNRIITAEITCGRDIQQKYFAKAHENIVYDSRLEPAHLRIYLKLLLLRNNKTKVCTIKTREFLRQNKESSSLYARARKSLCEYGYLIEEKSEVGQIFFRFPLVEAEELVK